MGSEGADLPGYSLGWNYLSGGCGPANLEWDVIDSFTSSGARQPPISSNYCWEEDMDPVCSRPSVSTG